MRKLLLDPTRVTLLIALAIMLGILIHKVFFLIGFLIAIIAFGEAVFHALESHSHRVRPIRRHP